MVFLSWDAFRSSYAEVVLGSWHAFWDVGLVTHVILREWNAVWSSSAEVVARRWDTLLWCGSAVVVFRSQLALGSTNTEAVFDRRHTSLW